MNHPTRKFSLVFLAMAFLGGCASDNGTEGGAGGAGGAGNEGGDIGAPCELEEHCASGLICDIHGESGSCQEPHGH